jgi:hypothetical protein
MMIIDNKFEIAQIVYLRTDKDQLDRIVSGFNILADALLWHSNLCFCYAHRSRLSEELAELLGRGFDWLYGVEDEE